MEALNRICIALKLKLDEAKEAFMEEVGAVDLVTIVILIGIAIALALLFRKQMTTSLTNWLEKIGSSGDSAIETTTGA